MEKRHELKQKILCQIKTDENRSVSKIAQDCNFDLDICYLLCEEIGYDGYIEFIDTSSMDGRDGIVYLTGNGKLFVAEGGYLKQYKEEEAYYKRESRQSSISNSSKIILTITGILAAGLAIATYIQSVKLNDINKEYNLEARSIVKREIIGKWHSIPLSDSVWYEFYEDFTWESLLIFNGDSIVYKGEYQIGNNYGLFLRPFGQHHWGYAPDFKDYNSGLRTRYYYYKDGVLIDNQEDYESMYIKE